MKKAIFILFLLAVLMNGCLTDGGTNKNNNTVNSNKNPIVIYAPVSGAIVSSPLLIEGKASGSWFFEASFPIKLVDENGELIAQSLANAKSDWMTDDYVEFSGKIEFSVSVEKKAYLVFQKDNPSGVPENDAEYRMPVVLTIKSRDLKIEISKIKVYFNNSKLDPEFTCVKVFPVEREIPKTAGIARATIEELLKGPTEHEKLNGYTTSINPGVKIQKLVIENGVAKIDFDAEMERGVGGSCRVGAIRSQITQTLKQFPSVKKVVISVDGRVEDALQP